MGQHWGLAPYQWTTIQIDYGYTVAGKWSAYYTACEGNGAGWAAGSWQTICSDKDVHPSDAFPTIRIGGVPVPLYGGSWSQAQYDNVKLQVVPEPSGLIALGSGLVGIFGFIRRKR